MPTKWTNAWLLPVVSCHFYPFASDHHDHTPVQSFVDQVYRLLRHVGPSSVTPMFVTTTDKGFSTWRCNRCSDIGQRGGRRTMDCCVGLIIRRKRVKIMRSNGLKMAVFSILQPRPRPQKWPENRIKGWFLPVLFHDFYPFACHLGSYIRTIRVADV